MKLMDCNLVIHLLTSLVKYLVTVMGSSSETLKPMDCNLATYSEISSVTMKDLYSGINLVKLKDSDLVKDLETMMGSS